MEKKMDEIEKILVKIPKEMKKIDLSKEEIEDIDTLVEIEKERKFVIETLACVKGFDLKSLDKLNSYEKSLLKDFLNLYALGEIIEKNIGYKVNWTKDISLIRQAYYLELEKITYFDLELEDLLKEYKKILAIDNSFYNNLISDDFKTYLKEVTGKDILDIFPKMYYNIEQELGEYEFAINLDKIIDKQKLLALFLINLNYPENRVAIITDLDINVIRDLKIMYLFFQNDSLLDKNLLRKRR